jgi:hypothetical protein
VTKLKNEGVGVVYIGGYHTEAGLIKRQLVEQGMTDAVLISGDALVTDEYWEITGEAGAGTLMTFSPDPAPERDCQGSRRKSSAPLARSPRAIRSIPMPPSRHGRRLSKQPSRPSTPPS